MVGTGNHPDPTHHDYQQAPYDTQSVVFSLELNIWRERERECVCVCVCVLVRVNVNCMYMHIVHTPSCNRHTNCYICQSIRLGIKQEIINNEGELKGGN